MGDTTTSHIYTAYIIICYIGLRIRHVSRSARHLCIDHQKRHVYLHSNNVGGHSAASPSYVIIVVSDQTALVSQIIDIFTPAPRARDPDQTDTPHEVICGENNVYYRSIYTTIIKAIIIIWLYLFSTSGFCPNQKSYIFPDNLLLPIILSRTSPIFSYIIFCIFSYFI